MLDVSLSELIVTATLAVLLVNPKDLPKIGQFFAQARRKISSLRQEAAKFINELSNEAGLSKDQYEEIRHLYMSYKKSGYFLDEQGNIKKFYDITNLESEAEDQHNHDTLFLEKDENKTLH